MLLYQHTTDLPHRNAPSAEFSLKYNVMPYMGLLTYGEAAWMEAHEIPETRDAIA